MLRRCFIFPGSCIRIRGLVLRSTTSQRSLSISAPAASDARTKTTGSDSSSDTDTNTARDTKSTGDALLQPELVRLPSLPLVGSFFFPSISGTPALDLKNVVPYWRKLHQKFGPFYSIGIPSFEAGLQKPIYIVRDPHEMLKVLKQEGTYPSGIIEDEWPFLAWMKKKNYATFGFFTQGPEWKRLRSFMQKDLLAPQSAREYLPGILKGAAKASSKANQFHGQQINRYLNFSALDMFTQVLFGGDQGMTQDEYRNFCVAGVDGLSEVFRLMREPGELLAHQLGLFETQRVKRCHANLDIVDAIASKRLHNFHQQMQSGDLTEDERNSYFYKVMKRQPEAEGNITQEEVIEICVMLLLAATDTTAGKSAWNVLQLALHPQIQEQLYEQLDRAVQREGGLTASIIEQNQVPLLPAIIRETHRCTPVAFLDILKKVSVPTKIHGVTVPAGSSVAFDCLTVQMDPNIVQDPMQFQPERWYKETVQARKDTPAAIIDHPFYSGPFSQGARKCPGSRVAHLEIQAILAQLVLDWKIQGPTHNKNLHWKDVTSEQGTVLVPDIPEEVCFVPRRNY